MNIMKQMIKVNGPAGNRSCTLRMPAKYADMTDEEAEYDGGFDWLAFGAGCGLGIFGLGAGTLVFNRVTGIGDRDTMDAIGIGAIGAGIIIAGSCIIRYIRTTRIPDNVITEANAKKKLDNVFYPVRGGVMPHEFPM